METPKFFWRLGAGYAIKTQVTKTKDDATTGRNLEYF